MQGIFQNEVALDVVGRDGGSCRYGNAVEKTVQRLAPSFFVRMTIF